MPKACPSLSQTNGEKVKEFGNPKLEAEEREMFKDSLAVQILRHTVWVRALFLYSYKE